MKKIKSILISQPEPQKGEPNPFVELGKKYKVKVDFRPFIEVVGVSGREVRKQKIDLSAFSAVILTSRNAVDHYFRLAKEMRFTVPDDMKYFCQSEAIAHYLQRYIVYRKRKIYFGAKTITDLYPFLKKHPAEQYLLPSSNLLNDITIQALDEASIDWKRSIMYETVSMDLSDLKDIKYDLLVFFSPQGITSLFENFPDFEQNDTLIATFGNTTKEIAEEKGLKINILPSKEVPSLSTAIENYIESSK
ncbi:MAG: uroporphyrinogen-III synthase [Flavobacteriales bacterium]|nr:uroporphyrinogen-III synthase [Flavobacteriales bacterium]